MRAALLSAGPSLQHSFDPAALYDLRIGVNTAVQFHKCDWWVCADSHRWIEIEAAGVKGKPKVFAIDTQRDRTICFAPDKAKKFKFTGWDEVFEATGASTSWMSNSAPAALILAHWLGAKEIDCYGVDMAGHLDATGIVDDSTRHRNETRWSLERGIWTLMVDWLAQRGTKVTRINGVLS